MTPEQFCNWLPARRVCLICGATQAEHTPTMYAECSAKWDALDPNVRRTVADTFYNRPALDDVREINAAGGRFYVAGRLTS